MLGPTCPILMPPLQEFCPRLSAMMLLIWHMQTDCSKAHLALFQPVRAR